MEVNSSLQLSETLKSLPAYNLLKQYNHPMKADLIGFLKCLKMKRAKLSELKVLNYGRMEIIRFN